MSGRGAGRVRGERWRARDMCGCAVEERDGWLEYWREVG